jgi:hypothetical protein
MAYTYKIPKKIKVTKSKGSDFLLVYRVPYGKDDTPADDREYKLEGASPVGNYKEWLDFAKKNKLKGVRFVEKTGEVTFKFVK